LRFNLNHSHWNFWTSNSVKKFLDLSKSYISQPVNSIINFRYRDNRITKSSFRL
jgi:hypothetical protein